MKQGGKDDFPFFLKDVCTLLFENTPRSERNPARVAIANIARLTRKKHQPDERETLEEWEAMKSNPEDAGFV